MILMASIMCFWKLFNFLFFCCTPFLWLNLKNECLINLLRTNWLISLEIIWFKKNFSILRYYFLLSTLLPSLIKENCHLLYNMVKVNLCS